MNFLLQLIGSLYLSFIALAGGGGGAAIIGPCASSDAGKQKFETSKMQYCNGTNWLDMTGSVMGIGGLCGGANVGKVKTSGGGANLEFCSGTSWVSMRSDTTGGCSKAGVQRRVSNTFEFCDGTDWRQLHQGAVLVWVPSYYLFNGDGVTNIELINTGADSATITVTELNADSAISIQDDPCTGQTLSSGMSCLLKISYSGDGSVHSKQLKATDGASETTTNLTIVGCNPGDC